MSVMPLHDDSTIDDLLASVLRHERSAEDNGRAPTVANSVFWVQHGTRLTPESALYRNRYVLVRVGTAFGACSFDDGELGPEIAEMSGRPVRELLAHRSMPLRTAALDAWLGATSPHRADPRARIVTLPAGTPRERAVARDREIAGLLDLRPGMRVGLIGVVNPLVEAIRARGATPLPCDLSMTETQWGDPVERDMTCVIDRADAVIATGMTLGNGTFDPLRRRCLDRRIPLAIYAQSGAAVAREYLGRGVSAVSAEHFPFSQFSADASPLYVYRHPGDEVVGHV